MARTGMELHHKRSPQLCVLVGFTWTIAQDGFEMMSMPPGTKINDLWNFLDYKLEETQRGFERIRKMRQNAT